MSLCFQIHRKTALYGDVSTQAYGHKILTGWRTASATTVVQNGMMPFSIESEYDTFNSRSYQTYIRQFGMAVANRQNSTAMW